MIDRFQHSALQSRLGIPIIYGSDAVHGNNNVYGATIFPHNVGLGATRLVNSSLLLLNFVLNFENHDDVFGDELVNRLAAYLNSGICTLFTVHIHPNS